MLEHRLIVPMNDNAGRSLDDLHRKLRQRLAYDFGGFTAMLATGAWLCPTSGEIVEEPVVSYTIAAQNTKAEAQLLKLAEWIALVAEQDAIYLRLRDGKVVFVPASAEEVPKYTA